MSLSAGAGTLVSVADDEGPRALDPVLDELVLAGEAPTPVDRVLDRVIRGLGAPSADAVATVFGRWGEVVGGVLAERTQPVSLTHGCLLLEADDPAVVSHVRWLEADLLARLAELLGPGRVDRVDVRVTPGRRRRRMAGGDTPRW